MVFLKNIWARIVISLIAGGMTSELVFIYSGDPYRPRSKDDPNFTLLYALIVFLILSAIVKKFGKKKP
jgi:hypothetical protein